MSNQTRELTLPVSGMTCASCVGHVEKALNSVPGVSQVVVNLGTEKASFVYDPDVASLNDFRKAVDDVGYSITTTETVLDIKGMTCASCVAHVEKALKELPGVID